MRTYLLCIIFMTTLLKGSQYDYLLFSHVLSDVESGIELKADVNARWQGKTPLYEAVQYNRLEIAYILLMNGADVNAIMEKSNETALHKATQNRNSYLTELLITAGAKINIQDEYGNTPLHYAAFTNDYQLLNILTTHDGDMSIRNIQGMTPAQIIMTGITIPPIILEDLNLAVSASAFKIASGIVTFNMRNLTNEPLTIFYTGLYVNGNLIGEQRYPLTIPAGTTITNVNTMQTFSNAIYGLRPNKNGQLDIKAGFSINYQAEGQMQQLFNSTQMNLQLWNPPQKPQDKRQKEEDSEQKK